MNQRIQEAFRRARAEGRAALIPYITAGYPRLDLLPDLVQAVTEAGADVIEIGIPFSDPLADGPVLQQAATIALANGTKIKDIFSVVAQLAPKAPPLVFLTYINPVFHMGMEVFVTHMREAGVEGVIIPDLPWAEAEDMRAITRSHGVALIPLVAPTSTDRHLKAIQQEGDGFVYGVSLTGVTGVRDTLDAGVGDLVRRIKAAGPLPVAMGFGISTPEQAHTVAQLADGVIVGSALVKHLQTHPDKPVQAAYDFVRDLRDAVKIPISKA